MILQTHQQSSSILVFHRWYSEIMLRCSHFQSTVYWDIWDAPPPSIIAFLGSGIQKKPSFPSVTGWGSSLKKNKTYIYSIKTL